jgi:hypothetical protein
MIKGVFKVTLADVWHKKISCIIHTSTQEEADMLFKVVDSYDHDGTTWASWWNTYKEKTCYRTDLGEVIAYGCMNDYIKNGEEVIEFSDLVATGGFCDGFRGGKIPTPSKPVPIEEQLGLLKIEFKNGSYIKAIPNEDVIRSKEPNLVWIDKIALPTATETKEMVERVRREILEFTNAFPKEEKKLKFTFYVTEGTRVDKSCNGTIPTMTTTVEANNYSRTAPVGTATCDKANYDMRQGVLEALANMYCDGDFDKVYNKAVKRNELADKKKRTCKYCGKVFDTIEEREAEEAWHVERKKARRERYLLRKRAKEIAFEEQAQKMAKEMIEK